MKEYTDRKIGFIQGVAYAAGLCRRYGSDSEQLLKESGITEEELRKFCDDYDLENLGLKGSERCPDCGGDGFAPNATEYEDVCETCGGSGEILWAK